MASEQKQQEPERVRLVKIRMLQDDAKIPTRATWGSAGYDLYALADHNLPPKTQVKIETGVAMEIPEHMVGIIHSRSGLAFKHQVTAVTGVIDSDYRGDLSILLVNHGQQPIQVKAGDRVAQLLLLKVHCPTLEVVDKLSDTSRQTRGFGSTGK